mmetsp:Transcript_29840/g.88360  ORF Transcript_29840/g.88360 Transcript_29840/m.88360 type:complete len:200 (-) Transcript_29840:4341-4940(-)
MLFHISMRMRNSSYGGKDLMGSSRDERCVLGPTKPASSTVDAKIVARLSAGHGPAARSAWRYMVMACCRSSEAALVASSASRNARNSSGVTDGRPCGDLQVLVKTSAAARKSSLYCLTHALNTISSDVSTSIAFSSSFSANDCSACVMFPASSHRCVSDPRMNSRADFASRRHLASDTPSAASDMSGPARECTRLSIAT